MSRYTGPRLKVLRALGVDLPGLSRKSMQDRPNPPGQHGSKQKRKSDFGLKLMEKQKLRYNYGITETQLRRIVLKSKTMKGSTGENILSLLERRLDNVVFRAGYAPTIPAARQLVRHGHIRLNNRRSTIPSQQVRIGDQITLHKPESMLQVVKESLAEPALIRPEWLSWDDGACTVRVAHLPGSSDVPFPIDMQQVVEYYALRT